MEKCESLEAGILEKPEYFNLAGPVKDRIAKSAVPDAERMEEAIAKARKLAKHPENKGESVVTLLPDTDHRYLSTHMFED